MSRALTPFILLLGILAGCTTTPPAQVVDHSRPENAAWTALQQWLNLQQDVAMMSTEKVVAELVQVGKPVSTEELLYFGLLNQQLQTFGGWTQARDAFRQLQDDESLEVQQRQLASIFLEYNQNRINWYQRQAELLNRHAELRQQLADAEQDKLLLEQKIQALTDLEAAISTRKEQ